MGLAQLLCSKPQWAKRLHCVIRSVAGVQALPPFEHLFILSSGRRGDRIQTINGESMDRLPAAEVAALLRGPGGEPRPADAASKCYLLSCGGPQCRAVPAMHCSLTFNQPWINACRQRRLKINAPEQPNPTGRDYCGVGAGQCCGQRTLGGADQACAAAATGQAGEWVLHARAGLGMLVLPSALWGCPGPGSHANFPHKSLYKGGILRRCMAFATHADLAMLACVARRQT